MRLLFFIFFVCFFMVSCKGQQNESEKPGPESIIQDSISALINDYHNGFIKMDQQLSKNTIGDNLIMINGNYSGEPMNWQAHMYLKGNEISEWLMFMIQNAGPFENQALIKSINSRNNSSVVVTLETGKNKFRTWTDEEVTYMFGKEEEGWKIVGIFIKNIKNPE